MFRDEGHIHISADINSGIRVGRGGRRTLCVRLVVLSMILAAQGAASQTIVKGDKEFWTKGPYVAYAAPWSSYYNKALKWGVDFLDTITIQVASFPSRTKIAWHWPLSEPTAAGVYGYNAISYGNYDGGIPQLPAKPVQVRAVVAKWAFDWSYVRSAGDFNLLTECFLTSAPDAFTQKVAEIGFLLHVPAKTLAWTRGNVQLGIFTDGQGRGWNVSRSAGPHGPYYLFLPASGADVMAGMVDMPGAFRFLRGKGALTGNEWMNGMAFGVEPVGGGGVVTTNHWYPQ